MVKTLNLTEDIVTLISNFQFCEALCDYDYDYDDNQFENYSTVGIDQKSIYGGGALLEDMARLLGKYDKHIEGTEEEPNGALFDDDLTEYLYSLHDFISMNLISIEEIVHQFATQGGVKPGVYKDKDNTHIWQFEEN